jgi:XTP/dITP diphosphohydrolase/tetrapyrrole methylase family protein/MazG family protein/ATP diphosphatase
VSADRALEALRRLDAVTRRLRKECPWDREQDERTIVPHTVDEAYELADAAERRDDAKLLDELGDVLFQVVFLALLLEEREAGDLDAVARGVTEKLIRRHPHVFGEVQAETAGDVLRNWDRIKRSEPGFEEGPPENLPATLYARKLQRRSGADPEPDLRGKLEALEAAGDRDSGFVALGELMFDLVAFARRLQVDPELALRAAADRAHRSSNWQDAPS